MRHNSPSLPAFAKYHLDTWESFASYCAVQANSLLLHLMSTVIELYSQQCVPSCE